jgi:hypothetical protein
VRSGLLSSLPAIFNISCSTYADEFSSRIIVSCISPVPLGFVTTIISPLSYTYTPQRDVSLYTYCLFVYSIYESDILHFMFPLLFLIPAYRSLLLALDGHSSTKRSSPGGAFTLMHPVVKVKSWPNYASRAVFHYSLSPLYRLVCISRLASLWIYSQRERSGSKFTFLALTLDDCHFSPGVVVFAVVGYCAGFTTVFCNCGIL